MLLKDQLSHSGSWLFRWRSYLPVLFLGFLATQLVDYSHPLGSERADLALEAGCLLVGFLGLAIRAHVVGHSPSRTSGRNTKTQIADVLNTTGLYSVTRNPLYVGNLLMWVGAAMFFHDMTVVLITICAYWLYYERIVAAEESYLETHFGSAYTDWAARTPVFLPKLTGYVRPALPFSWRTVLRREYSGMFGLVATLFLFETLGDFVSDGTWAVEPVWIAVMGLATAAYLALKVTKRRTTWLDATGR
tara:strand:+ start:3321 stop:4061 length:741 start_codon:yes stop_codon:yes gene_type:complete